MRRIYGAHRVQDQAKVVALSASMVANGWQGAPIVLLDDEQAMTGVHRLAACAEAGIEPETVLVADLLTSEQFAEMMESVEHIDRSDWMACEAAGWVLAHLPELAEQYGIQQG